MPSSAKPSDPVLSVTGLGYVGLPVAVAFARAGLRVIGYDADSQLITRLQAGESHVGIDTPSAIPTLTFTNLAQEREAATVHLVTVPTPVDATRKPDLTLLRLASLTLGSCLKKGDLVVYESTVYPGATREVCVPLLEKRSSLEGGVDFDFAYSPERINPGDTIHSLGSVVKIVAGNTPRSTKRAAALYAKVLDNPPYIAPSIEVAEAAKVLENTQRDLNIALMNEMAKIFARLDLDTNDVIDAAASKWNFHPYRPGLVGGHCIGVDPYYLLHKAETLGYAPETIIAGRRINNSMGDYVAGAVTRWLLKNGCTSPVVTILGVTFKENIDDVRNSRVRDIVLALQESGVTVNLHDPYAAAEKARAEFGLSLQSFTDLSLADAVILAVPHREYVEKGWRLVQDLLKPSKGMVADVKGVLPRTQKPATVELWRL